MPEFIGNDILLIGVRASVDAGFSKVRIRVA